MRETEIKAILMPAGQQEMTESLLLCLTHEIGNIFEAVNNSAALILEIVMRDESGTLFKPFGAMVSRLPALQR